MGFKPLKIAYFGTPNFAVAPLEMLLSHSYEVCVVVTQPDQPAGRGKKLTPSPVKEFAKQKNIPVLQPEKIKADFLENLQAFGANIYIVCAYGKILPEKLISQVPYIINIHASLLPKYRGASPIHFAIKNGDKKTGVSIMKIVKELDAGDVLLQKDIPIEENDNLETVSEKLSDVGSKALIEGLEAIQNQTDIWIPQDVTKTSYAGKIHPQDAKINWNEAVEVVHRFVHSFSPSPGAFTFINGEKIKLIQTKPSTEKAEKQPGSIRRSKKNLWVATKDHWLEVLLIQRSGKNIQTVSEFINGYRDELSLCE